MFLDYEKVVIFDMEIVEFNDLNSKNFIQFSARKYEYNKLIDKLEIMISDNVDQLNPTFTKRTRITPNLLKQKGISLITAKTKMLEFIGDLPLITYKGNIFYFAYLWNFLGLDLNHTHLDIIDICEYLNVVNNPDNVKLVDLAKYFEIDFDNNRWHNSSYDVTIISHLWFKLKAHIRRSENNE